MNTCFNIHDINRRISRSGGEKQDKDDTGRHDERKLSGGQ